MVLPVYGVSSAMIEDDDKGIGWAINSLRSSDKMPLANKGVNVKVSSETKRLKYCLQCCRVWEISYTGSISSYGHMPSYGLPRKDCMICKKEKGLKSAP